MPKHLLWTPSARGLAAGMHAVLASHFLAATHLLRPAVAMCSVGTVVMSAVVLSCAIIGLHGAMRVPDDLFLDDSDVSMDPLILGQAGQCCQYGYS